MGLIDFFKNNKRGGQLVVLVIRMAVILFALRFAFLLRLLSYIRSSAANTDSCDDGKISLVHLGNQQCAGDR